MMVNKYQSYFLNLEAYRRFNIIKQKDLVGYDPIIGGATLAIFPLNILIAPLMLPIFAFKSEKLSEFALKLQYFGMLSLYLVVAMVLIPLMSIILYGKCVFNSIYILNNSEREAYPY